MRYALFMLLLVFLLPSDAFAQRGSYPSNNGTPITKHNKIDFQLPLRAQSDGSSNNIDLVPDIALTDGDSVDFSGVTLDTTGEGLILTQPTDCDGITGVSEGTVCYDTTDDSLCVYDGTAFDCQSLGSGGFTSFNLDGDTGSETITNGNTANIVGGTNISTAATATDTLTVNLDLTAVTDTQLLYDSSDTAAGISQFTYDGTNLTLTPTAGDDIPANEVIGEFYNNSGATIFKCAAVYISGFNVGADLPEIAVADADDSGKIPAVGIVFADISTASSGLVLKAGDQLNLDTTTGEVWSAGEAVYVNTSGTSTSADCGDTLTNVKPTGGTTAIQKMGTVMRVNAVNGAIEVSGAGRSNDVPNAITIGTSDTINTDSVTLDNTWSDAQVENGLTITGLSGTNTGDAEIDAGTAVMGTTSISANTCATVVTVSATGVATTDVIDAGFNGDPTGVTGYGVGATDGLVIYPYPTANNVNFKVCNGTGTAITPGALTLNWRVDR